MGVPLLLASGEIIRGPRVIVPGEAEAIPEDDTSSRHLRHHRFWDEDRVIQPGKAVGWILSVEEEGARFKQ